MSNKIKTKHLKQIETQSQSGRSMVEMLGVLAIIGVLSIGGITGYRRAMDKHIANQILYEMNLNSTQLAMLLQRGDRDGVTLSLGSPYDDGKFRTVDYGFKYGCGEDTSLGHECQNQNETVYYIKATGLPEKVCNILDEAVFSMPYYYDSEINGDKGACQAEDNTVAVLFNVNYANKNGADSDSKVCDEETMPCEDGYHCDTKSKKCVKDCTATDCMGATPICDATTHQCRACTESDCTAQDNHCDTSKGKETSGTCVECTTNTHCGDNTPYCDTNNGNTCKSCYEAFGEKKPYWNETSCTECPNGGTWNVSKNMCVENKCAENADCKALKGNNDYFCDTSGTSACLNGINTNANQGVCRPVESPVSKEVGTTTYYKSPMSMDWWSAKRYCDALKDQGTVEYGMVSKAELTNSDGTNGALWSQLGWSVWVWTSTFYNNSNASCAAYIVYLPTGRAPWNDRYSNYEALCK